MRRYSTIDGSLRPGVTEYKSQRYDTRLHGCVYEQRFVPAQTARTSRHPRPEAACAMWQAAL